MTTPTVTNPIFFFLHSVVGPVPNEQDPLQTPRPESGCCEWVEKHPCVALGMVTLCVLGVCLVAAYALSQIETYN